MILLLRSAVRGEDNHVDWLCAFIRIAVGGPLSESTPIIGKILSFKASRLLGLYHFAAEKKPGSNLF